MLISQQRYFKYISELNDTDALRDYLINHTINNDTVVEIHRKTPILSIEFYVMLLTKLHKITKTLINLEPMPVSECVKTVTSIITQATITLEKHCKDDIDLANEFIQCIGLSNLSKALYVYFSSNKLNDLECELNRVRDDILFVKNNVLNKINNLLIITDK